MDPKTYFSVLHLFGLVIGLGSVTTLDFYLLRFLRGDTVSDSDARLVKLVSYLAAAGLAALWISGMGFLTLAWLNTPELLTNPKVHAKLVVVGILTINGAFLHFKVLPMIGRAVGGPLFCKSGGHGDRIWMRTCGAVSAASWWTPFVLGAVRELNFAASMWVFLAAYLAVLAMFGVGFTVVESWLSHRGSRVPSYDAPDPPRDLAAPRFATHPEYNDLPYGRSDPKNKETRHVTREKEAFVPDYDDHAGRAARERLRGYHSGAERSGGTIVNAGRGPGAGPRP